MVTQTTFVGADGVTRTVYEVPTQPESQTFTVSLGGVTYEFTLTWCPPAACWTLDIADDQGNPIVQGLQLITGADLLEQFEYLEIGGSLLVQSDFDPAMVPNYGSLGSTGHLYFVAPAL